MDRAVNYGQSFSGWRTPSTSTTATMTHAITAMVTSAHTTRSHLMPLNIGTPETD